PCSVTNRKIFAVTLRSATNSPGFDNFPMIHHEPTPLAFSGAHPSIPTTSPSRMVSALMPSTIATSVSVMPRHSIWLLSSSLSHDNTRPCVNWTPVDGGGAISAASSLLTRSDMSLPTSRTSRYYHW